jgi:uncharacterized MAPEG superfamily protein
VNSEIDEKKVQKRLRAIVIAYPFVVLMIGAALNILVFGVKPFTAAFPSIQLISALVIAAVLLIINHAWLMTATELTRARFKMHSTPEEWAVSGKKYEDAPAEGVRELKRHHDTHLNTTENIVYYILLVLLFVFASPSLITGQIWIVSFAIARLGYTYSFLSGKDNARGLFMTLSLLPMFGMASYLVVSLAI